MNVHPCLLRGCATALLSFGLGCGAVATPSDLARSDGGETDAAAAPGTAAAATCAATLDAYCATRECPATWADAQSAAHRWCTKPYGVRNPEVELSTRACSGTYHVTVGDGYVGETYVYDATLSTLVAVYRYSDTGEGAQCAAGAPTTRSGEDCGASDTWLCAGQPLVDAGSDGT